MPFVVCGVCNSDMEDLSHLVIKSEVDFSYRGSLAGGATSIFLAFRE